MCRRPYIAYFAFICTPHFADTDIGHLVDSLTVKGKQGWGAVLAHQLQLFFKRVPKKKELGLEYRPTLTL